MFALDQFKIKTISENNKEGVFEISPLPRGFGQTLGNVMRRVLLSSIPGSAVTSVKFNGVQHEYSTLAKVQDDVLTILLRFKELAVHSKSDEPVVLTLKAKGKNGESKEITAADIEPHPMIEIVDPKHHITHLNGNNTLDLEITVERGVGFAKADNDIRGEVGLIPLDADYGPVKNVKLEVGQARVGQNTDLDKVVLEITTNGAVKPSVVLHQTAQVISEMSNRLITVATEVLTAEPQGLIGTRTDQTDEPAGSRSPINISDLGLSNRLTNSLLRAGYTDLYDLEGMADEEIANIKGMGAKSLTELKSILDKYNVKRI